MGIQSFIPHTCAEHLSGQTAPRCWRLSSEESPSSHEADDQGGGRSQTAEKQRSMQHAADDMRVTPWPTKQTQAQGGRGRGRGALRQGGQGGLPEEEILRQRLEWHEMLRSGAAKPGPSHDSVTISGRPPAEFFLRAGTTWWPALCPGHQPRDD